MSQGIILLVVIGLIIAYAVTRTRRRLGLAVTGRHWIGIVLGVMIAILLLWAYQLR
jgi:uncharacterized membrane protein YeaQ/YmgE (transglycosylase-associated protein family)